MPGFIHLRTHSAYSLLEGALPVGRLVDLACADGMPALGLADRNNLFGALEFSEKAAGRGLQPLIGITAAIDLENGESGRRPGVKERRPSVVLLARDETGYRSLMKLSSRAWLESDGTGEPAIRVSWLADHGGGLTALTGGPEGPADRLVLARNGDAARAVLVQLAGLFPGSLYVELQRHGREEEQAVEPGLVELAYELGLPLVATNQPFFAAREDFEAHDALLCVAEGRMVSDPERRQLTPEHRFRTRAEMTELFADLPEALANTVEVARRCSWRPRTHAPILPRFRAAQEESGEVSDEAGEMRRQAVEGLARRLAAHGTAPGIDEATYSARLDYELGVIERMQYPGYFLIVADFIKWAKAHDIPVGPGRGSGAGSLVAWALTITDLDPLRFGLLFERFLNPERVSMPDFDIDFCPQGRDAVIRYVQEKYGEDTVAQIITFGTLQARAVVRDVARVLGISYSRADQLSKMIPHNPASPVTLAQAVEGEPRLAQARREDEAIGRLIDVALKLEGLYRHASTHAAGIVIGDRPLDELVPLYKDPRSGMPATQFSMKWTELAGLVKFDFLGLKTLTVLDITARLLRERGVDVDLAALPLDDARTYEMLSRGETVGVFQLESGGMRSAIVGMRPDRFEDIIALVALYRPGPMANIPTYNDRKHGRETPDYIHPRIEPILKETFGVIIYQEQVMQIAQDLAGYSLGEADLLRRAMGKKIRSEMEQQRKRFVVGAVERGVDRAQADHIFELLARFADYGFNKSHAAAYALVAYQTAYLKANYPTEFLAASMTLDMASPEKISVFRREAARVGIEVAPPCVNRSGVEFTVRDGVIHYSLAALRNVGRSAVEHLVAARGDRPFADLGDFAVRIGARHLNKRALEGLTAAGAFDGLEPDRARVHAGVEQIVALAARSEEGRTSGQPELFGEGAGAAALILPAAEAWLPTERLTREFKAIGSFLSGHPVESYAAVLERRRVQPIADFEESMRGGATAGRLAGIVISRSENRTRTGARMGVAVLSDPTGQTEIVAFSELLPEMRELMEPGACVEVLVHVDLFGDIPRLRLQKVRRLDDLAASAVGGVRVFLRGSDPVEPVARRLNPAVGQATGSEVSIVILLEQPEREVEIRLPSCFRAAPQVAAAIRVVPGVVEVQEY